MVDAEWRILYEKMEKMVAAGANIILSKLPIGMLYSVTQVIVRLQLYR